MIVAAVATAAILGYLLGGLPFGLLVGRLTRDVDLREHGSGRIGTTNALRTLGPRAAGLVLALDAGKGLLAAVGARAVLPFLTGPDAQAAESAAATASAAAVLGHIYSPFIGFRGGRGVATTAGGLLGLVPAALLVVAPATLLIMWRSRYVSLGSVVGAVLMVIVVAALVVAHLAAPPHLAFAGAAACLVVVAHRDNIARLRAGTERRLGEPATAARDG